MLRRNDMNNVAKKSLHMLGKAADIAVPGFRTESIHRVARQLGIGGVGLYRSSGFVHVDTGSIRYW